MGNECATRQPNPRPPPGRCEVTDRQSTQIMTWPTRGDPRPRRPPVPGGVRAPSPSWGAEAVGAGQTGYSAARTGGGRPGAPEVHPRYPLPTGPPLLSDDPASG